MTYREAIQIQIKALQDVYDNANSLRDVATDTEKEVWNRLRFELPAMWAKLQNIDNSLSASDAAHSLKGDYSICVNLKNI